jgi:hypothetical protein
MVSTPLGKVFISHSSADKPFVRRLVKRLHENRFETWLDEKELRVGDMLGTEIARAVEKARVVLVVVSEVSVRSKWLRYELNLATGRMVKGKCRVIPVVIGEVDPPPEVAGLLFADFRRSFASGVRSVLTALEYERSVLERTERFSQRADRAVKKQFGPIGWTSTDDAYRNESWETIEVRIPMAALREAGLEEKDDGEIPVFYDAINDFGRAEPLDEGWFEDFRRVFSESSEDLALIVTERPIGFDVSGRSLVNERVCYKTIPIFETMRSYVVFACLGELPDSDWKPVLLAAHDQLIRLAIAQEAGREEYRRQHKLQETGGED